MFLSCANVKEITLGFTHISFQARKIHLKIRSSENDPDSKGALDWGPQCPLLYSKNFPFDFKIA